MKPFLSYFEERQTIDSAGKGAILHLMHIEDLLIERGLTGIPLFLNAAKEAIDIESIKTGDVKLSVKWDGCVHPDTKIVTENGSERIEELINISSKINILTFNFEKNQSEFQPIIGAKISFNKKKWMKLTLENGKDLILTEDHEVFINRKGWIKAKDIEENDDILDIISKKNE